MDAKSQQKVIAAGFTILRKDDHPTPRIKQKGTYHQDWSTLEKYETKAARDREFDRMMNDPKFIND